MEKVERRVCEQCGEEKRTTIRQVEEWNYYCNLCVRRMAMDHLKDQEGNKGNLFAIIVATLVIGMILGAVGMSFI